MSKYKTKTWCELTEKEAEFFNNGGVDNEVEVKRCGRSECFDCYGDRTY